MSNLTEQWGPTNCSKEKSSDRKETEEEEELQTADRQTVQQTDVTMISQEISA